MENQLLFKYKEPTDGLNLQGKPVKIYKRENTTDYYLFAPKEPTRNGEINQLMLHCINEMGRQKNKYVFSLNDYFNFHNVTPGLIPEIKQAIIEIKAMINPIWYNEFTPLIKEWIENWSVQTEQVKTAKLSLFQIALIHVYEGQQITRENGTEIAKDYGHNSGSALFNKYTYYRSTANRKGKPTPCTPKKLKNKIELFESVVNYLSENNKQRAIDEINILKTHYENEY